MENRPDTDDAEPARRLTFGAVLAGVCAAASKRLSGWKLKVSRNKTYIALVFVDLSSVKVSAENVKIAHDGDEARRFQQDYTARAQGLRSEKPDPIIPADDAPGV